MLDFMFVTLMFFTLFAVIGFAIAGAMSWNWQSKTARLLEKMDRNRPVDLLRKMSAGGDFRDVRDTFGLPPTSERLR
jgi:hypothetical protein